PASSVASGTIESVPSVTVSSPGCRFMSVAANLRGTISPGEATQQLENYRLRRHVNVIGEVGWDVVVAGTLLGRVYLPADFVWIIHNITRQRWAPSKAQAVADLFYKLHLEPREWERDGPAIWARSPRVGKVAVRSVLRIDPFSTPCGWRPHRFSHFGNC
ncbi:hypothetical protein, partial [Nonomuraea aurantiaca]|uniref:hypothetical protein n=1 Tax=Nonomuraea aurantiaca TaxID=2878562 RepID=UPI001CD91A86